MPPCLHPIHEVLHVGQLEIYCSSSVSKNPLVPLFYQLPSHFLVSSVVVIFSIPFLRNIYLCTLRILPLLSSSFVISSYFSLFRVSFTAFLLALLVCYDLLHP